MTDLTAYRHLAGQDNSPLIWGWAPETLNSARIRRYCCSMAGIDLLYATQRVNDEVPARLQEPADQCKLIKQFQQMRRSIPMTQ